MTLENRAEKGPPQKPDIRLVDEVDFADIARITDGQITYIGGKWRGIDYDQHGAHIFRHDTNLQKELGISEAPHLSIFLPAYRTRDSGEVRISLLDTAVVKDEANRSVSFVFPSRHHPMNDNFVGVTISALEGVSFVSRAMYSMSEELRLAARKAGEAFGRKR